MKYKVKTIEDLEKIYYGPNKNGKNVLPSEIKKYEDYIRTKVISPMNEGEVKQFFAPIGEIKRISRSQNETNDFIIENNKLLIEVTSINTTIEGDQDEYGNISINLSANENEFIERINRCIDHVEKKKSYEGYYKIAAIYYDVVILGLKSGFIKKLFDPEFIRKTKFSSSSVVALIFLSPKVGGNIEIPKSLCYVKEGKMVESLRKIKGLELKLLEDKDATNN